MKFHRYNPYFNFVKAPMEFNKHTDRKTLQYCLGSTLYMPGTKDIKEKVVRKELDVTSFVMCCEDAIKEEDLPLAEQNIFNTLDYLAEKIKEGVITLDDIPLIFIRVRNPQQFKTFSSHLTLEQASVLTGFNFPKFNSRNALDVLTDSRCPCGVRTTLLPICIFQRKVWFAKNGLAEVIQTVLDMSECRIGILRCSQCHPHVS